MCPTTNAASQSPILTPTSPGEVAEMLEMLLGRGVTATAGGAATPWIQIVRVGVYIDAERNLRGLAGLTLPLANTVGAGLMMIPRGRADEATAANTIGEGLDENIREIFNVATTLFASIRKKRVILAGVCSGGTMPPYLAEPLKRITVRQDLNITVDGYTGGTLTMCYW
ncbi:MAG: hypothetical protein ACI9WU_002749 [Myxococcota bacterium]|jgi:hypothetical protein